MEMSSSERIRLRLKPLYLAAFFNGLVFWYVVDKLLTTRIGVSTAQLGLILAMMSVITVVGEIPTGILADRWSRKGVLLLSFVFLGFSSFFGLIATAPWHYWMLSAFWGVYAAMYSGTYEAIVYDVILEEEADSRKYESLFGRVGRYESVGLVLGSLLGGLFASGSHIKVPFALSLLSCMASGYFVLQFHEPLVHKSHEVVNFIRHTKDTLKTVVSSKVLIHYFLLSLFLGLVLRIYWEYTQFWYIQLGLPRQFFGIAWSLMLATMWVRSYLADKLTTHRSKLLLVSLVVAFMGSIMLTISNPWIAVVAGFITMTANQLAFLILTTLQQDLLPSRLRAGATSVFNSTGNIAFIPIGMLFGYLALDGGITRAAWVPATVMWCSVIVAISVMRLSKRTVE